MSKLKELVKRIKDEFGKEVILKDIYFDVPSSIKIYAFGDGTPALVLPVIEGHFTLVTESKTKAINMYYHSHKSDNNSKEFKLIMKSWDEIKPGDIITYIDGGEPCDEIDDWYVVGQEKIVYNFHSIDCEFSHLLGSRNIFEGNDTVLKLVRTEDCKRRER